MSLQSRLFIFFISIVVLPLALASLLSQRLVLRELESRANTQLTTATRAATAVYAAKLTVLTDRLGAVVSDPSFSRLLLQKDYPGLEEFLRNRVSESATRVDYMLVADPEGHPLAKYLGPASFLRSVDPPTPEEIAAKGAPEERRLLAAGRVQVVRGSDPPVEVAQVSSGYYLDNKFARELAQTTGVDSTIVIGGRVVATTAGNLQESPAVVRASIPPGKSFLQMTLGGEGVYAVPAPLAPGIPPTQAALVMSLPQRSTEALSGAVRVTMLVVIGLSVLGSVVLGFMLTRIIARPVREVSAAANAIAGGNYDLQIKVRSKDEVGQLARAFNEMARRLSIHIAELQESREELKRALDRFGETLRATHDRATLLDVVLETSMDTLRAERGMLMLVDTPGDHLSVAAKKGIEDAVEGEIKVGEGVAGYVAATGNPARWPNGFEMRARSPVEPEFRTILSVPIHSHQRVIAVLNVYDREGGLNFTESDLGTLMTLAEQAGVAIENVLLHEEAQRLSITDGLTGVWNYRYFRMQYEQEIDRSSRFRRPFSLIVCDIDNFKSFNDTYGHQVGDSVLIELARRMKSVIRDIDVLARYGGEEFVLILPETDSEGGLRTAERIRAAVADSPFQAQGEPIKVTVSIGVSCYPEHGDDGPALLKAADTAMYIAKRRGKNRALLFGPGIEGEGSSAA